MPIDSHHHLWRYNDRDYVWMTDGMDVLRQDYLPADLAVCLASAGIDATVVVQARQMIEETQWLCDLAGQHAMIRGVVGWAPLVDARVESVIEPFADDPKLVGLRHVLHDEPDDAYMLREDFNRGLSLLQKYDWVYDLLIFARHLPQTIALVDRHPDQRFVVDHIAKPVIQPGRFDAQWAAGIAELARREHVSCKLSGVVTEVRVADGSIDLIRPYYQCVLEAFGPGRLMFGSDWPVCRLRCSYEQWTATVRQLIADLSADEQAQVMGDTAARVYGLSH